MPKVIIEIVDNDDEITLSVSGAFETEEGIERSTAQLLGISLAASVKAGFYDDLIKFASERIAMIAAEEQA